MPGVCRERLARILLAVVWMSAPGALCLAEQNDNRSLQHAYACHVNARSSWRSARRRHRFPSWQRSTSSNPEDTSRSRTGRTASESLAVMHSLARFSITVARLIRTAA
jgi:hypothetical protein